jgi:glycosyltransferase involved in cell wall biosynthesis
VGEGEKAALLALRDELELTNLTMWPERPRAQMPAVLSAADVALVPLRRLELFQGALPSKMFDAWACACPVLLSIDGEARDVLEQADAGVFVEPEDACQMAQALCELREQPDHCAATGRTGGAVEANYSRQQLAVRLEALLVDLIQPKLGRSSG